MSLHETLPPGCEPACHGCRHRGWEMQRSLAQKHDYLARVLRPWLDRLSEVESVAADERLGYRDRVTLTTRWNVHDGWRFGLVRRDELIAIHDCPVHTARVNALVRLLRETLPPPARMPVAYLHVAGAQATLIVKARRCDASLLESLLPRLASIDLDGLWVHCHPSAGRRLFARSGWTLAWGKAWSVDAAGLRHGPTAFQQLLPRLHAASLELAKQHLQPDAGSAVLDLYCGIGASLRAWRAEGAGALGIELAGDAVSCAALNAPGAEVLRGTCVQRLPQVRDWWRHQEGVRLLYTNPPRSGLEPELLSMIVQELRPPRLAYLSCSAGTLARDLQAFETAGYRVARLQPYDFFPQTHHVETLALLDDRLGCRDPG